jgi:hypothetical protein
MEDKKEIRRTVTNDLLQYIVSSSVCRVCYGITKILCRRDKVFVVHGWRWVTKALGFGLGKHLHKIDYKIE